MGGRVVGGRVVGGRVVGNSKEPKLKVAALEAAPDPIAKSREKPSKVTRTREPRDHPSLLLSSITIV